MDYEDLKAKKDELLAEGKKTAAINYVDRMLELTKDLSEIRELRLQAADLYFDIREFAIAQKKYTDFAQYYPNHPQAEHAEARAIEAAWMQSLTPDRDPSNTHEVIEMANAFLKNSNYSEKREQVKNIKREALVKLLCKEINTIEFYLRQNNTKAVEKRIEFIKREFKELIDEKILRLEPIQEYHDAVAAKDKPRIKKAQENLHKCYSGVCMLHHDTDLHKKVANTEKTFKPRKTIDYFLVP